MSTTHDRAPVLDAGRRIHLLIAGLSLAYGVAGLAWLLGAGGFAFGRMPPSNSRLSVLAFLPEQIAAGAIAVLGFAGVPLALGVIRTRPLLAVAGIQAVFFGAMATSVAVVSLTGYLLVLVGLPIGTVWLMAGALRQPATRLLLLAIAAALTVVQVTIGLFDWSTVKQFVYSLGSGLRALGLIPLFAYGAILLGAGWALLLVRGLREVRGRCVRCGRPGARWTRPDSARRWGWWATVIAAACPLPYALHRLTWLLPTPIGATQEQLAASPGGRTFGLGLGLVALVAGGVTLGLIRPWGEVWPRWVPFAAGQPVPMRAVVIPGGVGAVLLLIGGLTMPLMVLERGDLSWEGLGTFAIFPFLLWGIALAAATAAYYYRRRTDCSTCTTGGTR